MDQVRGVLLLADPLRAARGGWGGEQVEQPQARQMKRLASGAGAGQSVTALIFREDERCLPQAQAALWELRRRCGWICVVAEGSAAGVALALAAQLPVDRVALIGRTPLGPQQYRARRSVRRREVMWMDAFARRNLSLVIAEILLVDVGEAERRKLVRGLGRAEGVRWMDGGAKPRDFVEPWGITENNLRI